MSGSLVARYSLTRTPPRGPTASPASRANLFSGRTPTPTITNCACSRRPDLSCTIEPFGRRFEARDRIAQSTVTPCAASASASGVVISMSSGGKTCSCNSTSVVAMPRATRFSTISSPMKPAPTTTACRTPWSIRALIASVSFRFRSVWMPGKSMPGIGGTTGAGAGRENQLVVAFFVLAASGKFADAHLLRRSVDGLDRGQRTDVEVEALVQTPGGRHEQLCRAAKSCRPNNTATRNWRTIRPGRARRE